MHDQTRKIVGQAIGWRGLKGLLSLALVALTGCFGPTFMANDMDAYNRHYIDSETEMLLFNIGQLSHNQPPHFMMMPEVDQTRSFSGSGGFQWANPATWTAGPFGVSTSESPLTKFLPIQGPDFAQRFETPLRDKFSYLLEDDEWYAPAAEKEALVMLFAQSLDLRGGDDSIGGQCKSGLYVNRRRDQQDQHTPADHYYSGFSACVQDIIENHKLYSVLIDGHHEIPTKAPESELPKAADLVSALQANYEWTKQGKDFVLTNPVKIPGWLDYDPSFAKPPRSNQWEPAWWPATASAELSKFQLDKLPSGYHWKHKKGADEKDKNAYALVPDGYDLSPDGKTGYVLVKPQPAKLKRKGPLSYVDEIVEDVWPVPQDYVYVELRNGATEAAAEQVCLEQADPRHPAPSNNVLCGYFKIGNFFEIMKRLAGMACNPEAGFTDCEQSIFGIGSKAPPWADHRTSYTYHTENGTEAREWAWVPAHNPKTQPLLARRDSEAFITLYKLYQMSLVDTSKLATGTTPITISPGK
jgi:hypothetical protein